MSFSSLTSNLNRSDAHPVVVGEDNVDLDCGSGFVVFENVPLTGGGAVHDIVVVAALRRRRGGGRGDPHNRRGLVHKKK